VPSKLFPGIDVLHCAVKYLKLIIYVLANVLTLSLDEIEIGDVGGEELAVS